MDLCVPYFLAGTTGRIVIPSSAMDHADHVALLRKGIPQPGGCWADLGSGRGAFTLALAQLLGPEAHIHSVDRDGRALKAQERALRARFPDNPVTYHRADFTRPLDLPPLDGIVIANALHFVPAGAAQLALVRRLHGHLLPGGRLLLVEYGTDQGNRWVPYPLSFLSWQALAGRAGFRATTLLATRPSRFLGQIYAAQSLA